MKTMINVVCVAWTVFMIINLIYLFVCLSEIFKQWLYDALCVCVEIYTLCVCIKIFYFITNMSLNFVMYFSFLGLLRSVILIIVYDKVVYHSSVCVRDYIIYELDLVFKFLHNMYIELSFQIFTYFQIHKLIS
jgi:hypothetical protein